jgi:rod shape-determining protein MreC
MFSKKTVVVVGVIGIIMVNILILAVTSNRSTPFGPEAYGFKWVAPFQNGLTASIRFFQDIWGHYFFLVSVTKENEDLSRAISQARERQNQLVETELSNIRLRKLINFQKTIKTEFLAAELVGRDPSPWFKTIIIDKGSADGVNKGSPVVIPEGIVGQIIHVSARYSKVLLMIDPNSAVDAQAQRTRARGIVKGEPTGQCLFDYVLRKHDIAIGDVVISSGLDGVFPKGLRVGRVSTVIKRNSGIFQEVTVTPFVDFETLEEVLVIVNHPTDESEGES